MRITREDIAKLREEAYNVPEGWSGSPWMEELADRLEEDLNEDVEDEHLRLGREEATNRALFKMGEALHAAKSSIARLDRAGQNLEKTLNEERNP